jgi:ribosomal protein S21
MSFIKDEPVVKNIRDFEKALRILKRRVDACGTLRRLRERMLFVKPAEKRRCKERKVKARRLRIEGRLQG